MVQEMVFCMMVDFLLGKMMNEYELKAKLRSKGIKYKSKKLNGSVRVDVCTSDAHQKLTVRDLGFTQNIFNDDYTIVVNKRNKRRS